MVVIYQTTVRMKRVSKHLLELFFWKTAQKGGLYTHPPRSSGFQVPWFTLADGTMSYLKHLPSKYPRNAFILKVFTFSWTFENICGHQQLLVIFMNFWKHLQLLVSMKHHQPNLVFFCKTRFFTITRWRLTDWFLLQHASPIKDPNPRTLGTFHEPVNKCL